MERRKLCGKRFVSKDGKEYVIIAGVENGEVAFEEYMHPESPLNFCCDAVLTGNALKGSYNVSYTVSKEVFFKEIDTLNEKENPEEIACELKNKYFRIPNAFLRLVGEAYIKEK